MAKPKKEELQKEEVPSIAEVEIESAPQKKELVVVEEPLITEVKEVVEKDEVVFLKKILYIQRTGGFGRHLDGIINERIKAIS